MISSIRFPLRVWLVSAAEDGWTHTVDHEVHDGLGHKVSDGLVDDADVRVHQVADGLHLPLQLRVHGHGVARIHRIFALRLEETKTRE